MKTNTQKIVGVPHGTVINKSFVSVSDAQRDLVDKAKLGSQTAFDALIQQSHSKLYGLIFNMVRNHEDTQDILQETYSKCYRSLSKFKGDSSFATWIHRIAYNTGINHIRSKKKVYKLSIDDINSRVTEESEYISKTTTPGGDKKLLVAELGLAIHNAMDKLSTNHRQVVEWFDIDGLSHNEIAAKLGVNSNTVRTRLFYAHKILQAYLTEYKELI